MDGIFPFVCAAFRRRKTRAPDSYERLVVPSGAAHAPVPEHAGFDIGGAYQSQSCRFPVRRATADGLGFSHDDRPPPDEEISGSELSPPSGGRSGRGVSRSRRFGSMRVLASCIGGP
uniref:Uncharacterized protein n=1 Tax=Avena sativa TaxID=4498 RepID=A0ACD5Y7E3_AVESA